MAHQRGLDRIVNLSDAVVAIAATLLVLPLADSAQDLSDPTGSEILRENGYNLLAFALSFVVICRLWLSHHQLYRKVDGFSTPLIWANFVWVFSIAFLPFPTELISYGIHDPTSNALYIGTILLANGTFTVQEWLLVRSPDLIDESIPGSLSVVSSLVGTATLFLALILAVAVPSVGLYALLLLVPSGIIERAISRRR